MVDKEEESWGPKTREDWVDLFSAGHKKAAAELRAEREEEEAKRSAEDTSDTDKSGEGGSSDNRSGKKRRTFADRLLGN